MNTTPHNQGAHGSVVDRTTNATIGVDRWTAALKPALFALLTLFALLATAPRLHAEDKAFDLMLAAIDTVPTRADLDARWDDASSLLMDAAADPHRDMWTRSRALSLLSLYPTPSIRAFLTQLTEDPQPRLRQMALYTLARSFGTPGDPDLVALIVKMTHDPEPSVRDYAIRAFRWIDHPAAAAALEALVKNDKNTEISHLARYVLQRRNVRLGP